MKIEFFLRFSTRFGQAIYLTANSVLNGKSAGTELPLSYLDNEWWSLTADLNDGQTFELTYHYIFVNEYGERTIDAERKRHLTIGAGGAVAAVDSWNDESFAENAWYTAPFKKVFHHQVKKDKTKPPPTTTHTFRVKAPLLPDGEAVYLSGSHPTLGAWQTESAVPMILKGEWWTASVALNDAASFTYKYFVAAADTRLSPRFEKGENRTLPTTEAARTTIHDGFVNLPAAAFRGAGIAIPVFSLRTANSFGIGEFSDIKCLVDWAKETGIKLIQLLPVNDTTATFSWKDSYPYAAISAFALHPVYINLSKVAGKKGAAIVKPLLKKQKSLNALPAVDYDQVILFKMNVLRELYDAEGQDFLLSDGFTDYFEDNKDWLVPYAAFCYNRDKFGTVEFATWKTASVYNEAEVARLASPKAKSFTQIAFVYFIQYHLHLQLKEAVDYAHKKGIALKGDLPIGIYRHGADAWVAPQLYNMNMQAGAPPDDFAVKGQNWGFPTYNWQQMEADHFKWWNRRFQQMSAYFDAFRIDHILGFFRIWSVPMNAVEGILGRFAPALPVTPQELGERGLWVDYDRYCKPFIVDSILYGAFGDASPAVMETYLEANNHGGYDLKEAFNTQRKVESHFATLEASDKNAALKTGLYNLISNVILLEEEGSDRQRFHVRISVEQTTSFQYLDEDSKAKLRALYVDYFFRRQDNFWKGEAMKKLPALKKSTQMLVCGEDLGMVPATVPQVMQQLGILSLEVQRMPKDPRVEFFHPAAAPYLSVVTPSTHDMSTIRGWWEEDRSKTQSFYNTILHEGGAAPYFCEPWVARAILLQHLYAPAMWSIFQLQDLLAASDTLRRGNPAEERINDPANPQHYWNYRMHLPLEQLIKEKGFNSELKDYITNSGRG